MSKKITLSWHWKLELKGRILELSFQKEVRTELRHKHLPGTSYFVIHVGCLWRADITLACHCTHLLFSVSLISFPVFSSTFPCAFTVTAERCLRVRPGLGFQSVSVLSSFSFLSLVISIELSLILGTQSQIVLHLNQVSLWWVIRQSEWSSCGKR